jgi:uncharacterized CHY-type Zn-finger protein
MIGKHKSRIKRKQPLATAFEYFCGVCDMSFQTKEEISMHRKQLECRQKIALSKGVNLKKTCKICQRDFENLIKYKEHIYEVHPGVLHR